MLNTKISLYVDEEGYEVIPDTKPWKAIKSKGIKCGKCGMKFDNDRFGNLKPITYSCRENICPIMGKKPIM